MPTLAKSRVCHFGGAIKRRFTDRTEMLDEDEAVGRLNQAEVGMTELGLVRIIHVWAICGPMATL